MQVACPYCNRALDVPDTLAGRIARCGACSTLFTVPEPTAAYQGPAPPAPMPRVSAASETFGDVPLAAGPPVRQDQGDAGGLAAGDTGPAGHPSSVAPLPYRPPPWSGTGSGMPPSVTIGRDRLQSRVGIAGGLMLTLGILTVLWAGLMVVYVFMADTGVFDGAGDPEMPRAFAVGLFIILGVLSLASGIIQLVAGVNLLRRRLAARTLGMTAAILGLCSLWACCVWPFAIGFGIYALVVLVPNKPG